MKRYLSGIQPSGELHIGNYFGAIKQFIELQDEYEGFVSIVNYHAMTSVQDAERLREDTFRAAVDHLALGIDPKKTALFVQSDLPEVTELTWIFNTLITVPFLERAVAYKDKVAQGLEPTAGLFDYPVLQAADILIVEPDIVPVGEDQRQHIEMTREIARKFNSTFGEVFKEPKEHILESVAVVPGTDGRKMSKSYNNTIPIFASDEELKEKVMSIVTDSKDVEEKKDPETDNVFALHKLFSKEELDEIHERYVEGGIGYKESKEILADNINEFLGPFREKRGELLKDKEYVYGVLEEGVKKARGVAKEMMEKVREVTGIKYK